MSINNYPLFVAQWFNEAANESTFILNLQTHKERGFALWPMGKIAFCRLAATSTTIIITITTVALVGISAVSKGLPTKGLWLFIGLISVISTPIPEVVRPLLLTAASVSTLFHAINFKLKFKLYDTLKDSALINFTSTLDTVAEIYHGVKALFFGYTTTRLLNEEQIELMNNGAKINEFFKKVPSNYTLKNGKSFFEWHKEIIIAKGKNTGVMSLYLSKKDNIDSNKEWETELSDESVLALRQFMYFQIVPLKHTALDLFFFAEKFQYVELKNICLMVINNDLLDKENLKTILFAAVKLHKIELSNICYNFVYQSDKYKDDYKAIIDELGLTEDYSKFAKNPLVKFDLPPYEINADTADIEFVSSNKECVKAHQSMLQLKWNIEFNDPNALHEKDVIIKSEHFAKFTKETIEDFLSIVYFKILKTSLTQDSFFNRLDNLNELIKNVESPELKNDFNLLREAYLRTFVNDIISERFNKVIDMGEAIKRLLVVRDFARDCHILPVVEQCKQAFLVVQC